MKESATEREPDIHTEGTLRREGDSVHIEITLTGEPWQSLLRFSFSKKPGYVFVGGAAYFKGSGPITLKTIRDISLMPGFCHTRIYPREVDGRWIHSCMYVKMPLLLTSSTSGSSGIAFPACVDIEGNRIPLSFSLFSSGEKTVFELGIFAQEEVFRRKGRDYDDWMVPDVELQKECVRRNLRDRRVTLSFDFYRSHNWKALVRSFVERRKEKTTGGTDLNRHLNKSVNWLNSAFDPECNLFLLGTRRDRQAAAGGYWGLPTYGTLPSELYSLSKRVEDEIVLEMSRGARELMLDENASELLENGRVWYNTARVDPRSGQLIFYNHLGTGIAGYPGGQATALRALLERARSGDDAPRLVRSAEEGLAWLRSAMFEDGHWARTYAVFEETSRFKLETGEESCSVGANAEGTIALLLAYQVLKDTSYLSSARKALEWTNRFRDGGVLTSGYLRDSRQDETDGVSAIFAAQANLLCHEITGEDAYGRAAEEFATYLLTWQRWWDVPGFDTLIFSFSPRMATCETVWVAETYYEMYRHTGDDFWLRESELAFGTLKVEDSFQGYGEGLYYDENLDTHPLKFDAVYSACAVLRYVLRRMEGESLRLNVESKRLYRTFRRQLKRGALRRGWGRIKRMIG